ncbi:J domain-containing protein [Natronoglomus mannanivorans]|uniref:J domain-containing protein n=1 Tax=Natronoglomus mannanivorans TaxID=2979990 RepID=A0AAP3E164_9EURY|nr:J domain-containing protein [Halobacteria archaeon AArc-xg1-1]
MSNARFVPASRLYDVHSGTTIEHPAVQASDDDVRRALEEREIRTDGGHSSSGPKNIDWPEHLERTPAEDRTDYPGNITVLYRDAFDSVIDELERWGATDVRLESEGPHYVDEPHIPHKTNDPDDPGVVTYFRREGEHADDAYAIACDSWSTQLENARSIALYARRMRLAERCGVATFESTFATARLPAAESEPVAATVPPHEILGVDPDATDGEILEAFRERVQETHPDHGGDRDEHKRVLEAREVLLDE